MDNDPEISASYLDEVLEVLEELVSVISWTFFKRLLPNFNFRPLVDTIEKSEMLQHNL
jgi:hypothetical protein